MAIWTIHGDGKTVKAGEVVPPGQRLNWPRTIGIGMQHVVAMFGSTFLVPLITGFPPSTTLFFSAVGTVLFLLITRNKVPSYLGSSFAFIAPIAAATATHGTGYAQGGIIMVGALLAIIGIVVHVAGAKWIDMVMPPVVTGSIVALIGLNLAPTAWGTCSPEIINGVATVVTNDAGQQVVKQVCTSGFRAAPLTAGITVVAIVVITVLFRGILGRLSILLGVLVGYVAAMLQGQVDYQAVRDAAWIGLPDFSAPHFDLSLIGLFVPVVLVLVAENVGHVKSVAAMTGQNLDSLTGRALLSDGLATMVAGAGGGSGTTTYAENIGVMAATRIYSTAVYWVAAATALLLSLSPKFGAAINTIPPGVLGGAGTVLYGMIGLLGARIWVQNRVDFSNPVNLMTAAIALVAGIANFTFHVGSVPFEGIAVGSALAIGVYHLMRLIAKARGTAQDEPATPASVPGGSELGQDTKFPDFPV